MKNRIAASQIRSRMCTRSSSEKGRHFQLMLTHNRYKERLQLKFLKTNRNDGLLDGSKWTFIAGDIDDFRSGAPVIREGSGMVKKTNVNPVPLIDTKSSEVLKRTPSNSRSTHQLKSKIISDNPGLMTLYTK